MCQSTKETFIHADVHTEVRDSVVSWIYEQIKKVMWSRNLFHLTQVQCSRYVRYIKIVISVWCYSYSKFSEANVFVKERMAEWTIASRCSIKKFLVLTVAYVFTNILSIFRQPQPLLF